MHHDPDREVAHTVRALLIAATRDDPPEIDLLDNLRRRAHQQRPRRRMPMPSPARQATQSVITSASRGAARIWHRHRAALAGGLAALLAVALAVGLLPRGAGGPAPAAAAVLDAAARTAASRTPPQLGRGQFWYTRDEGTTVDLFPLDAPPRHQFAAKYAALVEEWWGPAGVERTRFGHGNPVVLDPYRAAWAAAGRPRLQAPPGSELRGQPARQYMSWPGILFPRVDWNQQAWNQAVQRLKQLPTDPTALERRLRDNALRDGLRVPPGVDVRELCRPVRTQRCQDLIDADATVDIFQAAAWLLARPITPPPLRAALFRVLANLKGIRLLGTMTDDRGRSGTAVAITFDGVRHELIFDPGSSLLLGQRDIIAIAQPMQARYPIGTTTRSSLYLTRVVDSITATS